MPILALIEGKKPEELGAVVKIVSMNSRKIRSRKRSTIFCREKLKIS